MNEERTNKAFHSAIVVGLWMGVALAVRLFGMSHESLWWDEYTSHVYLDAPSLPEFLWLNRTLDPLTLPFYYSLEYFWNHYINDSVFGLRLLSIIIGLATLPLVYALGRHIYGRRAGYVAIALLAFSPVHIHHSQSIRMYVVFVFLAAGTVFTFLKMLDRPGFRFWLAHSIFSVLMYWTHPFAGLIPAVLGCFLLFRYRSRVRIFWRWTVLQAFLFAPTVFYLSTVRFWPKESTSQWIEKPGLGALLADMFFDDVSAFHWQFRLSDFAQRIASERMVFDVLFATVIAVLLLWVVIRLLCRGKYDTDAQTGERTLLLLFWLVLPPLMLFVLSYGIRPCMFPRYTVHAIIPLYLLMGGAVSTLNSKVRRSLTSVLVGSMCLQWLFLQPGPQHTDWRSAGILLHEQASKDDIVLVDNFLWRDVFTHNLKHLTPGPLPLPVAAAGTQPLLAAQAALCTGALTQQSPPERFPGVWAVIALDYFDPGWPAVFEQSLRIWGISFERRALNAVCRIAIYKMTSAPEHPVTSMEQLFDQWKHLGGPAGPWTGDMEHDTLQSFGDLAVELALHGRTTMSRDIFNTLFSYENSPARDIYGNLYSVLDTGREVNDKAAAVQRLWSGYGFRENGQSEYACRAFNEAATLDSRYALACYELGNEYYRMGRYPEAAEAYTRAASMDRQYHIMNSLVGALRAGASVEGPYRAVQAYRKGIGAQGRGEYDDAVALFRQAIADDPHLEDAHTSLAFVLIVQRKIEEAREALNAYLALDGSPVAGAYGLLAAAHIARGELDNALACVDKAFSLDEAYGRQFGPFFYALLREKNYERTVAAMDVLKGQGVDLYPLLYEDVVRLLH